MGRTHRQAQCRARKRLRQVFFEGNRPVSCFGCAVLRRPGACVERLPIGPGAGRGSASGVEFPIRAEACAGREVGTVRSPIRPKHRRWPFEPRVTIPRRAGRRAGLPLPMSRMPRAPALRRVARAPPGALHRRDVDEDLDRTRRGLLRYGAFPVFPGGLRRPPGALIPHASVTMWAANTIGDDDASDQAGIRASWSTCVMPRASR
jgi:hypothetical protein